MDALEETPDVSGLMRLALWFGLACIGIALLLTLIGFGPGVYSPLITLPTAAYLLGDKARKNSLGLLLGAIVGAVGGYACFLLVSLFAMQGGVSMTWFPGPVLFLG